MTVDVDVQHSQKTHPDLQRVPLSFLITQNASEDPPVEPVVPLPAVIDRAQPGVIGSIPTAINVTAILDRTAAYHVGGDRYDTGVIKLEKVLVDLAAVTWRTKPAVRVRANGAPLTEAQARVTHGYDLRLGHSQEEREKHREERRQMSDQRAIKDQAAKAAAAPAPLKKHRTSWKLNKELAVRGLKHCGRCGKDKPLDEFRQNGYCRDCARTYENGVDERRHEQRVNPTRTCPRCKKTKPQDEFPRGSGRRACLECAVAPIPTERRTVKKAPIKSAKKSHPALLQPSPPAPKLTGLGAAGLAPEQPADLLIARLARLITDRDALNVLIAETYRDLGSHMPALLPVAPGA